MKLFYSILSILMVVLLFFSVTCFAVFADSETTVDQEGWVRYTRLNYASATYKVLPSQNEQYVTQNFSNIPIPYGPRLIAYDDGPIEGFWINVAINNVSSNDIENSAIVTVPAGESVVLTARVKIWNRYYPSAGSVEPIDPSLYECRVYLDNDYTRYLSAEVSASTQNGAELYYQFTNNTDVPVMLSRVSIGMFDASDLESYGFQFYVGSIAYRMFTSSQMATQAITDAIGAMGNQISGSIENSTDQILNGWDGNATEPEGSGSISSTDDIESSLIEGSQQGFNNIVGWYEDTNTYISVFAGSLNMLSAIFDDLQYSADWWVLLIMSLALGIFSFLIGLVPAMLRRMSK